MTTVTISAGENIQNAIDAHDPGTTFLLDSGTWHQQAIVPKDYDSFIGGPNGSTILTGDNATSQLANNGGGTLGVGVLMQNITVEHYVPGYQQGAVSGVYGWTIDNCTFQFMGDNGNGLMPGHDTVVNGGHYSYNAGNGIGGYLADNVTIQGAEVAYNDTAAYSFDNDAGGIKLLGSNNVHILNNYVHDNAGHAIWADASSNWVIDGNTVANNLGYGIEFEISDGAVISNNTISGSTWAAIFLHASGDADVHNNQISVPSDVNPGLGGGIIFQSIDRGGEVPAQNIQVHDNSIAFWGGDGQNGWRNYDGSPGHGDALYNNQYYVNSPGESHWMWSDPNPIDFDSYQAAYGQDNGSTIHSLSEYWF